MRCFVPVIILIRPSFAFLDFALSTRVLLSSILRFSLGLWLLTPSFLLPPPSLSRSRSRPAMPTTLVSSPGKVLVAGGYLVLDPKYSGVVVSTSSRFYTVIDTISEPPAPGQDGPIQIRVRSPQFLDATWVYFVEFDGPDAVRVEQVADK